MLASLAGAIFVRRRLHVASVAKIGEESGPTVTRSKGEFGKMQNLRGAGFLTAGVLTFADQYKTVAHHLLDCRR